MGIPCTAGYIGFEDLQDIQSIVSHAPEIILVLLEGIAPAAREKLIMLASTCPFTEVFIYTKMKGSCQQTVCIKLNQFSLCGMFQWNCADKLEIYDNKSSMHRTVFIFKRHQSQSSLISTPPISAESLVTFSSYLAMSIALKDSNRALQSGMDYRELFYDRKITPYSRFFKIPAS